MYGPNLYTKLSKVLCIIIILFLLYKKRFGPGFLTDKMRLIPL